MGLRDPSALDFPMTFGPFPRVGSDDFRSPKATAEKNCEDCGVAVLAKCCGARPREERFALCGAERIADWRPSCGTLFTR